VALVNLGHADIALFSDPMVRVQIPYLTAAPRKISRAGTFVTFEGDAYPTAFRGTAREQSFDMAARFGPADQVSLVALIELIDETAPNSADSRLLLRTHVGSTAGIDPVVAVQVFELTVTPVADGPGVFDVNFTATVVAFDFAV
jgi:hypothetical protein